MRAEVIYVYDRASLLFSDPVGFVLYKRAEFRTGLVFRAQCQLLLDPFVLVMNQPPQIGSRVQWWDARGQLKHGSVRAINVLSDSSHIIVIKVEDGQPATVTLPIDHVQLAG